MAWIESHQALGRHPKTLRLATELHSGVPGAIGHLHLLWWWALEYSRDGVIAPDMQEAAVRACMWTKKSQRFWAALISAGFIDETEDGLKIHDWEDYAGRLLDKRAANVARMKRARDAQRAHHERATSAHDTGLPYSTVPVNTDAAAAEATRERARARGTGGFQPLGAFLKPPAAATAASSTDFPDEVRERLARPPISAHG